MARQLVEEGVTHIFGIPGVQLDHATNGLAGYRDQITFINARHEHTTTYAADGYARSTGKVGVALVVPGARCAQRRRGACDRARLFLESASYCRPDPNRWHRQGIRALARDP